LNKFSRLVNARERREERKGKEGGEGSGREGEGFVLHFPTRSYAPDYNCSLSVPVALVAFGLYKAQLKLPAIRVIMQPNSHKTGSRELIYKVSKLIET
jgi:hypothetical protein